MKIVFVFSLLLSLAFATSLRTKRSVLQFRKMIHCVTYRSALLDYNAYGCWCGIGGRGDPVDATDRCCQTHDRCYDSLKDNGTCSTWKLYAESYSYSTKNCDTSNASITCGKGDDCEVGLCQCDRDAAICFSRSTFNRKYRYWSNWKC